MSDCECLKGCIFFNDKMKDVGAVGAMYKKRYCTGDSSMCARYMVFKKLGKASVPADLYPNQQDRAKQILTGR